MARIDLCAAVLDAIRRAELGGRVSLNQSQREALDLLVDVLSGDREVPLGAIQGPPGTGKTSVIEAFARSRLPSLLEDLGSKDLIIYVAPTNYLAVEAFTRIASALLATGAFKLRDILDATRVYGKKIFVGSCRALEKATEIPGDLVRRVLYGDIEPGLVKIVFATEFQRVTGKLRDEPTKIHLIVDEASKSLYFRPFIAIADSIMRSGQYPASLVALGDPEQAISVPEEFRRRGVPLLMSKIMKLLRDNSLDENFSFLDVTYRIPMPSEEPISYGFYNGRLYAHFDARIRLRDLEQAFTDSRRKVDSILRDLGEDDSLTEKIHNAIYEAVGAGKPLVVLDTGPFRPSSRHVSTYDPYRARVAAKAALVLRAYSIIDKSLGNVETAVTAPYSDVIANFEFKFSHKYTSRMPRLAPPRALTVHALIGGEADAVIAVLGKEYGSRRSDYWSDYLQTIYFNEPQVLNVQLSRHKRLLVVVGSVEKLSHARDREAKLSRTAKRILELVEGGQASLVKL